MKITYTDHALKRIKERGITKAKIKEAIQRGRKYPTHDGSREARLRVGKGMLSVIYQIRNPEEVIVVTTYIL